jgi:hypothetical protein
VEMQPVSRRFSVGVVSKYYVSRVMDSRSAGRPLHRVETQSRGSRRRESWATVGSEGSAHLAERQTALHMYEVATFLCRRPCDVGLTRHGAF